jgi:hypothetical protein
MMVSIYEVNNHDTQSNPKEEANQNYDDEEDKNKHVVTVGVILSKTVRVRAEPLFVDGESMLLRINIGNVCCLLCSSPLHGYKRIL